MKRSGKVILVVVAGLLFASVSKLVWLPDILFAPRRVLASMSLTDGSRIRVVEFWNDCDFYTMELQHVTATGHVNSAVIDPDHSKVWFCKLKAADARNEVEVFADTRLIGKYNWQLKELVLRNGSVRHVATEAY